VVELLCFNRKVRLLVKATKLTVALLLLGQEGLRYCPAKLLSKEAIQLVIFVLPAPKITFKKGYNGLTKKLLKNSFIHRNPKTMCS